MSSAEAEEFKAEGNAALNSGKVAEAVSWYTKAIDADPDNHIYYSNRSAAYLAWGDAPKALQDANSCVRLDPEFPKGYSRVGAALLALERYSEAINAYQKGLDKFPEDDGLKRGAGSVRIIQRRSSSSHFGLLDSYPFTEHDAYQIFAYEPGIAEDPDLWYDFCSTFKKVPGKPAPPAGSDLKVPFQVQAVVWSRLPSEGEDESQVPKTTVDGGSLGLRVGLPLGAMKRCAEDEIFLRRLGNVAFNGFRDTALSMVVGKKASCVSCGKKHTQTTRNMTTGFAKIKDPDGTEISTVIMKADPFLYACNRSGCIAKAQLFMESRKWSKTMASRKTCSMCNKYEDPEHPLKVCSRCKCVFYCNSDCQVSHYPSHKKMCKKAAAMAASKKK